MEHNKINLTQIAKKKKIEQNMTVYGKIAVNVLLKDVVREKPWRFFY